MSTIATIKSAYPLEARQSPQYYTQVLLCFGSFKNEQLTIITLGKDWVILPYSSNLPPSLHICAIAASLSSLSL
jgi:hypothetical protein